MKPDNEGQPQLANDTPTSTSERKTTDLCMKEREGGVRCMRHRGHDGKHECLHWRGGMPVRWD